MWRRLLFMQPWQKLLLRLMLCVQIEELLFNRELQRGPLATKMAATKTAATKTAATKTAATKTPATKTAATKTSTARRLLG